MTKQQAVQLEWYSDERNSDWNSFIRTAKNGLFQFERGFIEYHGPRFEDASLIVTEGDQIIAALPAHRVGSELRSHAGLTFGGLVIAQSVDVSKAMAIVSVLLSFVGEAGIESIFLKSVPHFYHRAPAEEIRFALRQAGAECVACELLTVISPWVRPRRQLRRQRQLRRAVNSGVMSGESSQWGEFWSILEHRLSTRYGASPVHSLAEIRHLERMFPDSIRLLSAEHRGEMAAGVVAFENDRVCRTQYMATTGAGREVGALDLLLHELSESVMAEGRFLDFGGSQQQNSKFINAGLLAYKEGFGGYSMVHEHFQINVREALERMSSFRA